jgi:hypothetical protein
MGESLPTSGDTAADIAARRARFAEGNAIRELPRLIAEAHDRSRQPSDRFGSALDAIEILAKSTARVRRWATESKFDLALVDVASTVEDEHRAEVEDRAREVELAFHHAMDVNQDPRRVPGHARLTTPALIADEVREWVQGNPDALAAGRAPIPPLAAASASTAIVMDLDVDGRVTLNGKPPMYQKKGKPKPLATSQLNRDGEAGRALRMLVALARISQGKPTRLPRLGKAEKSRLKNNMFSSLTAEPTEEQRGQGAPWQFSRPVRFGPRLEEFLAQHRL